MLDLDRVGSSMLSKLTNKQIVQLAEQAIAVRQLDRKENALQYYIPASEDCEKVHLSTARVRFVGGGNGSGKSETAIVEGVMAATGVIPRYLLDKYPDFDWRKKKLRGPTRGRIVVESLTTTLANVILPKLRWNVWTGNDEPGGELGHWGWVPKQCLINGSWKDSWSEKYRVLRLNYLNPYNYDQVIGESSIQFQSKDVDPSDQESGDLHWVILDEPPTHEIYAANEARTMRVNGWMMLPMTWPDNPAINVDWLYDEVYERGIPGPHKHPDYETFRLRTTRNQFIDQTSVASQISRWSSKKVQTRIEGQPVRFSNRVHELFTDLTDYWCFTCDDRMALNEGRCSQCGSTDTTEYNHVMDVPYQRGWPVIWALDPHPRKPHMSLYVAITPDDDWWAVACLECKGDPTDMRVACSEIESEFGFNVVRRIMDPNMAAQVSGAMRERTWKDDFDAAGLYCDAADRDPEVGRTAINTMLRPDPVLRRPRLLFHPRCEPAIFQMRRFMWDEWKPTLDRSQKQRVKDKYDDYPACLRYVANEDPSYDVLAHGGRVIQAQGARHYPRRENRWAARRV